MGNQMNDYPGKPQDETGYIFFWWPGHPLASGSGGVWEHRLVYWQEHGYSEAVLKLIREGARIHHLDGKRDNNRPSNLELRVKGNHPGGVGELDMVKILRMVGWTVER